MLEPHAVSRYFDKRRKFTLCQARGSHRPEIANRLRAITNRRMPKLSLAIQASSHLILAACATIGMDCDHTYFAALACRAQGRLAVDTLVADKGYDAEANHALAREMLGLKTLIPVRESRWGAVTTGAYRRRMQQAFQKHSTQRQYRQRWQVETVNSMVKRNLGSACRARTGHGRKKDLLLRVITHNLMILANL
jgi:transposase